MPHKQEHTSAIFRLYMPASFLCTVRLAEGQTQKQSLSGALTHLRQEGYSQDLKLSAQPLVRHSVGIGLTLFCGPSGCAADRIPLP